MSLLTPTRPSQTDIRNALHSVCHHVHAAMEAPPESAEARINDARKQIDRACNLIRLARDADNRLMKGAPA